MNFDDVDFSIIEKVLSKYEISVVDVMESMAKNGGRFILRDLDPWDEGKWESEWTHERYAHMINDLRDIGAIGGIIGDFGGRWAYDSIRITFERVHSPS